MAFISGDNVGNTGLTYRGNTGVTDHTSYANPDTGDGKLWLPIWAGEVINAYDEYNMFEGLVTSRTISSGTTVEFPVTGTVDLRPTWDAGEELIGGQNSKATTFQIKLDKRPMAAHFEIDNVDLMLTQWEFRSELARQAAMTLANTRDKQLFSYLVRAGLSDQLAKDPRPSMNLDNVLYGLDDTGANELDHWGVTTSTAATRATGALSALECVEKFIVHLQENNIPYGQLYMAVTPQCFMDIRSLGVARTNSELASGGKQPFFGGVAEEGGLGAGYKMGLGQLHDTLEYMGCTIVKSNHVFTNQYSVGNVSAGNFNSDFDPGGTYETQGLGEAKYNLQFGSAGVKSVIWTPEAIGNVRLQGLKVDSVGDIRRNTQFTVASMMSGTGVLRPECAAVISSIEIGSGAGAAADQDRSAVAALAAMDADSWGDA